MNCCNHSKAQFRNPFPNQPGDKASYTQAKSYLSFAHAFRWKEVVYLAAFSIWLPDLDFVDHVEDAADNLRAILD